jgi:ferredoxin-thioredoxin reductase catalytic subunit
MSERPCRWVYEKDAPDGRFFVPGCWGGVMDRGECYCARPTRDDNRATIEDRIDHLERRLDFICEAIASKDTSHE